jgi:hypothetical protein
MRARTFLIGIMLVLGGNMARAQWVVTDPGNLYKQYEKPKKSLDRW